MIGDDLRASDLRMNYGVRYRGHKGRGFARFVSVTDAREFVRIPNNWNTEVIDLETMEVMK